MKNGIIIVLSIITIGFIGYFVYDKFYNNELNETECPKCDNNITTTEKQISTMNNGIFTTDYGFLVYNNDSLFIQFFADNVVDQNNLLGDKDNYDTGMKVSEDGSTKIEGYRLKVDNIRSLYSFPIGQADLESLIIIYDNGTVDVLNLNYYDNSEIIIESFDKNYNKIDNAIAAYKKDTVGSHGYDFIYMD